MRRILMKVITAVAAALLVTSVATPAQAISPGNCNMHWGNERPVC